MISPAAGRPRAASSSSSVTSAEHAGVGAQGVVGLPVGGAVLGEQPAVGQDVDRAGALGAGVGAGPVALLLHERAEALLVDGHALLGGHLEGDVDREAVGVVQGERLVAGQRRGARLLRLRRRRCRTASSRRRGCGGTPPPRRRRRRRCGRSRWRARGSWRSSRRGRPAAAPGRVASSTPSSFIERTARRSSRRRMYPRPSLPGVTPSPMSISPLRTWSATTRSRTSASWSRAVGDAGELGGAAQHRGDLVDLVHVVDALQQVGDALQAHAGVDVLLRQLAEDAELLLAPHLVDLVLHEDEVPDLEEPVAGEVDRPGRRRGRTPGRGRRRSPSTGRPGRARRCASSCPSCPAAGCARLGSPAMRCQASAASSSSR